MIFTAVCIVYGKGSHKKQQLVKKKGLDKAYMTENDWLFFNYTNHF